MKKIFFVFFAISLVYVSIPQFSYAANNPFSGPVIIHCTEGRAIPGGGNECGWGDVMAQVNKIIDFLFYISVILATVAFVWCGILLLTAGGDTGKVKNAKEVFIKVVIGFFWIFAAWLVVHMITSSFGLKSDISILNER